MVSRRRRRRPQARRRIGWQRRKQRRRRVRGLLLLLRERVDDRVEDLVDVSGERRAAAPVRRLRKPLRDGLHLRGRPALVEHAQRVHVVDLPGLIGVAPRNDGENLADDGGFPGVGQHLGHVVRQHQLRAPGGRDAVVAVDPVAGRRRHRKLADERGVDLFPDLRVDAVARFRRGDLERAQDADLLRGRQRRLLHQRDQLVEDRTQLGFGLRRQRVGQRDQPFGQRDHVRLGHHQLVPLGARRVLQREAAGIAHEPIGVAEQRVDVGDRARSSAGSA